MWEALLLCTSTAGCWHRYDTSTKHLCWYVSLCAPCVCVCRCVCNHVFHLVVILWARQLAVPALLGREKAERWETISVHWNNTQENYSLNLTTGLRASSQSHCGENGRVAIKKPHTRRDSSWITMGSRTQSERQSLKQWGWEGSLYVTPSFVFSVPHARTQVINLSARYWLSRKVKRLGSGLHLSLCY